PGALRLPGLEDRMGGSAKHRDHSERRVLTGKDSMRRLTVGVGLAVTLGILGVNTSSASAAEISSPATVSTNRCIMMSTL
ncbi:hypothetical protein, partial [Streptomyces soliscabiei]|uniref:hypothetical protein n=1 Tax=Streptomyces soliscabiei TaxID=588897 RepID=UPI0029AEF562